MSIEYEKQWYAKRKKQRKMAICIDIFFLFIIIGVMFFGQNIPIEIATGILVSSVFIAIFGLITARVVHGDIKNGNPYSEKVDFICMHPPSGRIRATFEYNPQTDHSYITFDDAKTKTSKGYMGYRLETELKNLALEEIKKVHGDVSKIE